MSKPRITSQSVTEVIPSDSAFQKSICDKPLSKKISRLTAKQSTKASSTPMLAS